MGECRRFQDLILTDYIDGELDSRGKGEIEQHISSCPDCRVFINEVQKDLVVPFLNVKTQSLPPEIWPALKERIQENRSKLSLEAIFLNKFKNALTGWVRRWMELLPRTVLAPAFGVLLVIAFIGSTLVSQGQRLKMVKEKEQGQYLASLVESPEDVFDIEDEDGGSKLPLEEYFL